MGKIWDWIVGKPKAKTWMEKYGHSLHPNSIFNAEGPLIFEAKTKGVCWYCGRLNVKIAKFCGRCGRLLATGPIGPTGITGTMGVTEMEEWRRNGSGISMDERIHS